MGISGRGRKKNGGGRWEVRGESENLAEGGWRYSTGRAAVRPVRCMAEGIRNRKFECAQSEMGGKRREEVGGQRREAGDVAQGAPQRSLCDEWWRKVGS